MRYVWFLLLLQPVLAQKTVSLQGVPLQLEWFDVNGDQKLDLLALMLESKTEGAVETWYEDGGLRGVYSDQTQNQKYLVTLLQSDQGWQEQARMPLGKEGVLGFALSQPAGAAALMVWKNKVLLRYRWQDKDWQLERQVGTPGLLGDDVASLSNYKFWYEDQEQAWWLVPDAHGMHTISLTDMNRTALIPYPETAFEYSRYGQGGAYELYLPSPLNIDGEGGPELYFQSEDEMVAFRLGDPQPAYRSQSDGRLVDLDGDGLADLLEIEIDDDVDRLRDLPKLKSTIKSYLATGPMTFSETPTADQEVPGLLLSGQDTDSDIQLAPPYLDVNGDGRLDLAGIALKLSIWQMAKAVAAKRLRLKFLINLSIQQDDGRFQTVKGGPFEMVWKLNLRRLVLPPLAQLTADYNGDGWLDFLQLKGGQLEITTVSPQGIAPGPVWRKKIPKAFRKPDQYYGHDLNGDGRAAVIALKIMGQNTQLMILEPRL